jgi:hypothetical protein
MQMAMVNCLDGFFIVVSYAIMPNIDRETMRTKPVDGLGAITYARGFGEGACRSLVCF